MVQMQQCIAIAMCPTFCKSLIQNMMLNHSLGECKCMRFSSTYSKIRCLIIHTCNLTSPPVGFLVTTKQLHLHFLAWKNCNRLRELWWSLKGVLRRIQGLFDLHQMNSILKGEISPSGIMFRVSCLEHLINEGGLVGGLHTRCVGEMLPLSSIVLIWCCSDDNNSGYQLPSDCMVELLLPKK